MQNTERPGLIFKQISLIMNDIDAVKKGRSNQQQGWKFRSIDDFYNEAHSKLAMHGVFTVPEVLEERREERPTKNGGVMTYSIMKMKYTFYAEDGSNVAAVVIGEGSDTGDKASNKAMSIAHKYALIQVFAVPTEDEKDPDYRSHDKLPKAVPHPAQPQTSSVAKEYLMGPDKNQPPWPDDEAPLPQEEFAPSVKEIPNLAPNAKGSFKIPDVVANRLKSNPDQATHAKLWMVPIGKFKGQLMGDLDPKKRWGYAKWIEDNNKEKGKEPTGDYAKFIEYHKILEDYEKANKDDEIPF